MVQFMQEITQNHIEGAKSGKAKDIEYIFKAFKPAVAACAAKLRSDNFDFDEALKNAVYYQVHTHICSSLASTPAHLIKQQSILQN